MCRQEEVMKIRDIVQERINWNALRQAKAVMPYLLDSPELRAMGERPNPAEPNIFTSTNLKVYPRQDAKTKAAGGDKITPLPSMSPEAWQEYMDKEWKTIKQNAARGDANAKGKLDQIKQAAAKVQMPIKEFIVMPHTADTMGLIHKLGVGPNNRYDFKNKGNNRANENKIKLSTDPNYFGAVGVEKYKATGPQVNIPIKQLIGFEPEDKMRDPKSMAKVDQIAKAVQSNKPMGPILARKYKNGYQVIDGHHRFWGHKKAGADSIKAQIVPPEDIEEEAPPGREKQVKALKKKFGKSGAYALAWAQHNKHGRPKKEAAGVGIITKQNTTADVKPGETTRQANKLGLGLTKRGRPARSMYEQWKEFSENFADGKKKGKSRPGRVKRAGASCKGSVTSLRIKAKKASGERAKMYHWCANMKSGRKKSK